MRGQHAVCLTHVSPTSRSLSIGLAAARSFALVNEIVVLAAPVVIEADRRRVRAPARLTNKRLTGVHCFLMQFEQFFGSEYGRITTRLATHKRHAAVSRDGVLVECIACLERGAALIDLAQQHTAVSVCRAHMTF